MTVYQTDALRSFDLINSAAQKRLQERIAHANGDIDVVRREVQGELARLDGEQANGVDSSYQADRAFCVGQLAYLDLIQQAETQEQQPREQGLWARFRSSFRRAEAVR